MFGKLGRNDGAGRGSSKRPGPQYLTGVVPGREETFSLERGKLDFGSIIRLTPDNVEEIRRFEAQGVSTEIKFDANGNNSGGNVMHFRFTGPLY